MVSQPRNHRSFSSLFDGDALCPGDSATCDWSSMIGDRTSELVGESGMSGMEGQESEDCSLEVFDIFSLRLVSRRAADSLRLA